MTIGLLSPTDVQQHLSDETPFLILDARPFSHYLAGHLPGALWMGWEAWCEAAPAHAGYRLSRAGYWGLLGESTTRPQRDILERMGISNDRPVLVYANGPQSKGREARIAWMLLYWGLSSVFLLNGGWNAWRKQGGKRVLRTPTPTRGQFCVQFQEGRRITLQEVRQNYQGTVKPVLVDTRTRAEFQGACHTYQPRMGRLPGAIHLPFTKLFDETGSFVSRDVYLQRLPAKILNAEQCIAYCEVGVRSCLFALLHELYTGRVVANYDGSIMEWALAQDLPMENGEEVV